MDKIIPSSEGISFSLTTGLIQVANSKVFCKLGNGTIRDLTQDNDTVYTHPVTKQCNYSVDLTNYYTKNEVDSKVNAAGGFQIVIDKTYQINLGYYEEIELESAATVSNWLETYPIMVFEAYLSMSVTNIERISQFSIGNYNNGRPDATNNRCVFSWNTPATGSYSFSSPQNDKIVSTAVRGSSISRAYCDISNSGQYSLWSQTPFYAATSGGTRGINFTGTLRVKACGVSY